MLKVKTNRGMLLLEIIVVIAVLAVVITIGSQAIFVSLRSSKSAGEKDSALKLAEETFEAVRMVAAENWLNLYNPPDGTGDPITGKDSSNHYYPSQSGGKWVLQSGDDSVKVGDITYTRYFYIDNVSRDSNKDIEAVYSSSGDDPSTQKISVTISSLNISDVTATEYVFRWRNKVCQKTDWSGGKTYPTDNAETCSSGVNTYYNDDGNIDNAGGSIKLTQ